MPDALADRLPPHDAAAERALLGGVFRDPDVLPDVRAVLGDPAAFYFDAHQRIWRAVLAAADRGAPVDLVTVHAGLRAAKHLDDAGGAVYLAELYEAAATGVNANYHAGIVRDCWTVRRLIHAANEVLRDAYDRAGPADELVAAAERRLFEVADLAAGEVTGLRAAPEFLRAALERIDERVAAGGRLGGLSTGYADLDEMLGGLKPGELTVVGARPSQGKTALAVNLAANAAAAGAPVVFFSLEQSWAEIAGRLLAMGSGVPMHSLARGRRLTPDEAAALARAAGPDGYGGTALHLLDRGDLSATQAAAVCRRAVRRLGVQLAVVDYLQLMRPEDARANRNQQVGHSARLVKTLARGCNIPVLLLAQLNRGVEDRPDRRPRLSDLRDSGEIEQHADNVLLLWPHPDAEPHAEVWPVDVIVAKQRNGPTGDVTLAYRRPVMRFENMARDWR
jgi:replicative DNA helicase